VRSASLVISLLARKLRSV